MFGHSKPFESKSKKIPNSQISIAAFATFVYSALMHEWLIYAFIDVPSCGEQMLFFTLQGVMTILEVLVHKAVLSTTGIDLSKSVPWILQVCYTISWFLLTGPLFLNPYIRDKVFYRHFMVPAL